MPTAAALLAASVLCASCGERSETASDRTRGQTLGTPDDHSDSQPGPTPAAGRAPDDNALAAVLASIETGSRLKIREARAVLDSLDLRAPAEPELTVGDPAPPLEVGGWVRGEPIEALGGGTIVVVELWATWCPPCLEAIAHLNELAERHADDAVRIVGVNVLERRFEQNELARGLAEFLELYGPAYPIAYESGEAVTRDWLFASGRNALPATYVVDRGGRIAWIGHPGGSEAGLSVTAGKWRVQLTLDEVLRRMTAGEWDTDTHAAERRRAERLELRLRRAADLIATGRGDDEDRGYAMIEALLATDLGREPRLIDTMAWHIATHPAVTDRRLGVAERLAATAVERSGERSGSALDTLALVLAERGRLDDAITAQRAAVARAGSDARRARFRERLDELLAERGGG